MLPPHLKDQLLISIVHFDCLKIKDKHILLQEIIWINKHHQWFQISNLMVLFINKLLNLVLKDSRLLTTTVQNLLELLQKILIYLQDTSNKVIMFHKTSTLKFKLHIYRIIFLIKILDIHKLDNNFMKALHSQIVHMDIQQLLI